MRRKCGQAGGNLRVILRDSEERKNATALQGVLNNNAEELLWVAEVMAGSRQAGEQCLAEAIDLAETAQYVGHGWMLSWIKRLLVHVALKRISGEIRELLPPGTRIGVSLARGGVNVRDRQKLRSIPPQRIVTSFDVLERACFILHAYLDYPVLDCALLVGCPRGWIEPICERVLKIAAFDESGRAGFGDVNAYVGVGVKECAD